MRRKTTIEIDDELLSEAKDILGTNGMRDTVEEALAQVIRAGRRRELAKQLKTGEGLDFSKATRRAARQWRT